MLKTTPDREEESVSLSSVGKANPHREIPDKVMVDGEVLRVHGRLLSELVKDPDNSRMPEIVVPLLVALGRITMLAAREKLGKSTLAAYVAACVSRGGELWGEIVTPGVVLWLGLEEDMSDAVRRFTAMGANADHIVMLDQLPGEGGIKHLTAEVLAHKPRLVVIDSLAAYASHVEDENGAPAWTRELKKVVALARRTRTGILLLHHASKGTGAYRGSTAIGAAMDMIVEMGEGAEDASVRTMKARGRWPLDNYALRYDRETRQFLLVQVSSRAVAEKPANMDRLKSEVRKALQASPGATKTGIRQRVPARGEAVDEALTILMNEGLVEHRGRREGYHLVAQPPSADASTEVA